MTEMVLLVDSSDRVKGTMDKLQAHQEGRLHRAYSIFIFNAKGELLLQQRASGKYHSAGLWSNTCCSHPRPGELTHESASRRLKEEMGLLTPLEKLYSFVYMCPLGNSLYEYEFDHVFIGLSNVDPRINREEVADFKWMKPEDILADIDKEPTKYTFWFQLILKDVLKRMKEKS